MRKNNDVRVLVGQHAEHTAFQPPRKQRFYNHAFFITLRGIIHQVIEHGKYIEYLQIRFLDNVVDGKHIIGNEVKMFHFAFCRQGFQIFFYSMCCLGMTASDRS